MNADQQDFAAKLTLIEWEAKLMCEELPESALRDRVQHIGTIARLLRLRLDFASDLILPPRGAAGPTTRR